jgi:hypothetical protein
MGLDSDWLQAGVVQALAAADLPEQNARDISTMVLSPD